MGWPDARVPTPAGRKTLRAAWRRWERGDTARGTPRQLDPTVEVSGDGPVAAQNSTKSSYAAMSMRSWPPPRGPPAGIASVPHPLTGDPIKQGRHRGAANDGLGLDVLKGGDSMGG
ncbi:hypothetical protein BDA96_02G234300 [Sorghum bicolor]|uniref:Uncharacterized protein n=2 Tax=Sorghum bicolor TaxID=4558 RepID=A0A921RPP8_SORBI|nr:uncharacterized protein LOC110433141 [Sorghum bicolor]KAG0543962.1 hypothetical protein BDA96_02G234300 [Sorghum bicolor]OQU89609.1 hypothetical protein SORBI_3002G223650 [Sorghum bicolor]|eukprot:XP_021310523.1 uncharacterized protein LOC110433141 [Sorghum bicolor]